jgi:NitT/TauT family transport system substrate-binding protein
MCRISRILLFTVMAFSLVSCFAPPISPVPSASITEEMTPLNVAIFPILSNVILKTAADEGYFAEQGLEVNLIPFQSSSEFIPLLLTGQLDVAQPAISAGFFNAVSNGGRLKMVLPVTSMTVQDCTYLAFIVRKSDLQSGRYARPDQWRGARIALTPAGAQSTTGYILEQVLQQADLTLADVELPIVDLAAQGQALEAGQVDIVLAGEPWVTRLTQNDALAVLFPAESYADGLNVSAVVYGRKMLDDPEIGNRFATAYLKAVRQYREGATQRNIQIAAELTGLPPEQVAQLCPADIPTDGRFSIDSIMDYQAWLAKEELLDQQLGADIFMDTSFAEAAIRILEAGR